MHFEKAPGPALTPFHACNTTRLLLCCRPDVWSEFEVPVQSSSPLSCHLIESLFVQFFLGPNLDLSGRLFGASGALSQLSDSCGKSHTGRNPIPPNWVCSRCCLAGVVFMVPPGSLFDEGKKRSATYLACGGGLHLQRQGQD